MIKTHNYPKFSDEYEFLNTEPDQNDENGILYTAQFFLMYRMKYPLRVLWWEILSEKLYQDHIMMFTQTPGDTFEREYVSHDNLTAIVSMSVFHHLWNHEYIWNHLKTHWFTYDDETGKTNFDRIMHPRDIIFYGSMAGNWICTLLLPFLFATSVITCMKDSAETSGKLLCFTRNKATRNKSKFMKFTDWMCDKIINKRYTHGWKDVFKIYYKNPEHPNRLISKETL